MENLLAKIETLFCPLALWGPLPSCFIYQEKDKKKKKKEK